jgi:hypothetical protein
VKPAKDNYPGHAEEIREAERIAREHESLRARNEQFAALTPAQKRVAIAEDVLQWIALGKLVAANGTYIRVVNGDSDARGAKTVNGFECHACALGSVFAVAVEREAVEPSKRGLMNTSDESMRKRLREFFDKDQLLAIEDAFEGFNDSNLPRASMFCDDIPTYVTGPDGWSSRLDETAPRRRMERIMKNIIANGGEFKP